MTPTHTRRRGRLYRYYVCLGASRRGLVNRVFKDKPGGLVVD
jgi:hypothetical protein